MRNQQQVTIHIGYSTDKAGLTELQTTLERIIASGRSVGSSMNEELKKAGETALNLSNILDRSFNRDLGTVNITRFNQELKNSGMTVSQIKSDLSNAGAAGSKAFNLLSSSVLNSNIKLKESNRLLNGLAETLSNTIKWGAASSIFNTVSNSIRNAYQYAQDLNKSLNEIRIVTGFSADNMENFATEANTAAKNLGASTLDYTNASLLFFEQGMSSEEVKARTDATVKAANVTGQTAAQISDLLTAV